MGSTEAIGRFVPSDAATRDDRPSISLRVILAKVFSGFAD
jgi:hypothetical protein